MLINFQVILFLIFIASSNAQSYAQFSNSHARFRGAITPERAWWDVKYYHLDFRVDPLDSTISGFNEIHYQTVGNTRQMQIDLQQPMRITNIQQNGKMLQFAITNGAYLVDVQTTSLNELSSIKVSFKGKPKQYMEPPYGGIFWRRDSNGNPFIASSNQTIGASVWWPTKDHPYDEPDSISIRINVPDSLIAVSNGRLLNIEMKANGFKTYHWFVKNPINNYGVNFNIGNYVHFSEQFSGESGSLTCDFYVLPENLDRAKIHFQQALKSLEAFEYWFGPYPFYEDGYKLVETPYAGMEHQSSITYGNQFKNGFYGEDPTGTGWGLKFDYIIIHETAHEWFANSITSSDIADLWIHEAFATYAESLYLEYFYGKEAAIEYILASRKNIKNNRSLIGKYHINDVSTLNMEIYEKGTNVLHMIRQFFSSDEEWRIMLKNMIKHFRNQVVSTAQIEKFIDEKTEVDLSIVFDQYLRDPRVPRFEYYFKNDRLYFRWANCIAGFKMPLDIELGSKKQRIVPTTSWSSVNAKDLTLSISEHFLINTKNIN